MVLRDSLAATERILVMDVGKMWRDYTRLRAQGKLAIVSLFYIREMRVPVRSSRFAKGFGLSDMALPAGWEVFNMTGSLFGKEWFRGRTF